MKPTIENLKDTFKIGYETFEESRKEAAEAYNLFHNRHYTSYQKSILEQRGQPKETFNVIKLFTRMLLGYYSSVVNTVKVTPENYNDIFSASVLNDLVNYTFRVSMFEQEMEKAKIDLMIAGICCSYQMVEETDEKDEFGRPIYEIKIEHVPANQIVLDPMSTSEDYKDARFIHRFKWLTEEKVDELFGEDKRKELDAYDNHLNIDEAEFEYTYNGEFTGYYKRYDNYLVVHSVVKDKDKSYSIYWSGETILSKKEITYKKVKFPYRVQKLHYSDKAEYYGLFREIVETQHAINQALIKIQLMVNTQKAFVETGSVENVDDFINQFNRVNAVIPVKSLRGIKIENLTREVLDQYTIIDKALDRVQRLLSINDSFLGMAYASDSGKKVQLQQNASVTALKYLTSKIENFHRLIGWDTLYLIQQYYTAHQVVAIADDYAGQRWLEVNRPLMLPTGRVNQLGQPEARMVFDEVLDPESGEPIEDDDGNLIVAPVPDRETDIAFTKANIRVESISYNDENEKNQQIAENFLNGNLGQFLMQTNPAGFAQAGALAIRNLKSKYSPEFAEILNQTSQMMQQMPMVPQDQQQG